MKSNRWKQRGAGLLAGLVAAILMTLALLLLRYLFGVATPSELVGDRIAPLLGVDRFLELLDRFGGYNNLKQIGVTSVIGGQLVVGAFGGLLYGFIVERSRTIKPEPAGNHGRLFVVIFVGLLWLVSLILLWPVLGTSYVGLPPAKGTIANTFGLLIAYALYGVSLVLLYRAVLGRVASDGKARDKEPIGRRALLMTGVGAVVAVAVGGMLHRLYTMATFSYDGTRYKGADVQAITPNDRFYVVTKNVVDPEVARSNWRLDIAGLVERPRTYSFEDLAALPAATQETTLRCISNQVGDGLMSNAVWKGVPLRNLIEAAGAKQGVVEVRLHGVDNYTDTFAIEKAMEPTTLVASEMNGEMIPARHGFPVRVIVPGLFGEKNVKWVTRIELVDHDAKGFYEQQGWGPNFVVPTTARFDVPDDKQKIKMAIASTGIPLRGVAHAGNRSVSRVEVSLDDGKSWNETRLDHAQSPLAWVLWNYDWRPTQAGEYRLVVRATDGKGELQTEKQRGTAPEGATGYHKITTQIEA
ncbi:MAG: molybdopterin-dependent oxidoreductase [Acidobacteriota bacterium]|nr:molybdopterin-dependent oxidoreductase [Acidobacteriota bacterium]